MADVYLDLKHLSDRHAKLNRLFAQLYKEGAHRLKTVSDIPGIGLGELIEGRYFDVTLAGITGRFSFAFQPNESNARVTCYRLNPLKPEVLESIAHFDFNGEGIVAGMKVPDGPFEGDDLRVNMDSHGSSYLLATYLHKALTAKPRPVC
jgi:hypothetical protein